MTVRPTASGLALLLFTASAQAQSQETPPAPNPAPAASPDATAPAAPAPPSAQTQPSSSPASPPKPTLQKVPAEEAMAVLGRPITGPEGKDVGRLVDVLVNDTGEPVAGVIDFGGFMGVGARKIAVDWKALRFAPSDKAHPITLELTPDQIKAAPEYKNPNAAAAVVTPSSQPASQ
jgi:PRC-barrel domain